MQWLIKARFHPYQTVFTCVNPDVSSEIVPASEGSAAPLALVALLARVPSDVVYERAGVGETPSTDMTLVWLLSCNAR